MGWHSTFLTALLAQSLTSNKSAAGAGGLELDAPDAERASRALK